MTRPYPSRPNPVHVEGGKCSNHDEDMGRTPRSIFIALAESLPRHTIGGYEWECDECSYNWGASEFQDRQGNGCDHARLIDLDLLIQKVGEL